MLNDEFITVVAAGLPYSGWERVQVTAGLDEASRTFSLETSERIGEWKFPPGTPIQILTNGDLLVSGYVNAYEASADANSHRISIRGRSKSQDLVDSSAEHDTGFFEEEDPGAALKKLDKFGVGVKVKVPLIKEAYMQLKQGESPFQFADRYLRSQGVTMMGKADGSVEVTNASVAESHFGILMEGQNIKSCQVSLTDGSRHSKYIVKGQRRRGTGASALRVKESRNDPGVKRHRPKVLVQETDTDPKRARARAETEANRQAGRSISASVHTQGFRDMAGLLFEPNKLIYVHAPILMHMTQTMLIERVTFTQDARSGSIAELTLVDPRAHKGKRAGKGGAVDADQPDAEAPPTDEVWTEGFDEGAEY
ncbi:MAG: phage baseplate assembly protein [Hyphomicrobiaceae bacterium]